MAQFGKFETPTELGDYIRTEQLKCGLRTQFAASTERELSHVAADWLPLLRRIRELPGSNLGPETGCPD
jgi:hypothetical protein